jgi:hypothetical protein
MTALYAIMTLYSVKLVTDGRYFKDRNAAIRWLITFISDFLNVCIDEMKQILKLKEKVIII